MRPHKSQTSSNYFLKSIPVAGVGRLTAMIPTKVSDFAIGVLLYWLSYRATALPDLDRAKTSADQGHTEAVSLREVEEHRGSALSGKVC